MRQLSYMVSQFVSTETCEDIDHVTDWKCFTTEEEEAGKAECGFFFYLVFIRITRISRNKSNVRSLSR